MIKIKIYNKLNSRRKQVQEVDGNWMCQSAHSKDVWKRSLNEKDGTVFTEAPPTYPRSTNHEPGGVVTFPTSKRLRRARQLILTISIFTSYTAFQSIKILYFETSIASQFLIFPGKLCEKNRPTEDNWRCALMTISTRQMYDNSRLVEHVCVHVCFRWQGPLETSKEETLSTAIITSSQIRWINRGTSNFNYGRIKSW